MYIHVANPDNRLLLDLLTIWPEKPGVRTVRHDEEIPLGPHLFEDLLILLGHHHRTPAKRTVPGSDRSPPATGFESLIPFHFY